MKVSSGKGGGVGARGVMCKASGLALRNTKNPKP